MRLKVTLQKAAGPTATENGKSSAATAEKKEDSKPKDPSRPVSSTPVAGTPWCVVWTGDNKVGIEFEPRKKLKLRILLPKASSTFYPKQSRKKTKRGNNTYRLT